MRHALTSAVLLAAALAGLAACDNFQAPASTSSREKPAAASRAFRHEISGDLSGYYIPATEVTVGKYRLTHLFLGQGADFSQWEGGGKSETFGPVMFEFADASGATVRVLPKAYLVEDGRVRFAGSSPELGEVSFEGALDQGALATARRNLGEEAPVLSGTLRAGGQSFPGQKFRWYGGD